MKILKLIIHHYCGSSDFIFRRLREKFMKGFSGFKRSLSKANRNNQLYMVVEEIFKSMRL